MTPTVVRWDPSFWARLDELLPAERGADGTPSAHDFTVHEIPPLHEALALDWQGISFPGEQPGTYMTIRAGRLFRAISLDFELAADGALEVFWLRLHWPEVDSD